MVVSSRVRSSWVRLGLSVALAAGSFAAVGGRCFGRESKFNKSVAAAIRKGVGFLLSKQNGGNWFENDNAGGVNQNHAETALVMDALLNAAQSTNDARLSLTAPKMKAGLRALLSFSPNTTYAGGFQASAVALLPSNARTLRVLNKDRIFLGDEVHSDGGYIYSWDKSKGINPKLPHDWDNSNTQYGVLGMWAIADTRKMGVSKKYWLMVRKHYQKTQQPNGTWYYNFGPPPGGTPVTMTPAGVASLYLIDQFLDTRIQKDPVPDKNIQRGLAYIIKNPGNAIGNLYAMYGDERVGLASGLKFFGTTNWFHDGATQLISTQQSDGSFGDGGFPGGSAIVATAYGLLYLARGGVPVVFNKLQYKGPWDARLRDDANVTEWISKRFQVPLKWQVVSTKIPTKEWLDAPILLITGHIGDGFKGFSAADVKKFRHFVDAGGLIVSTSDGGSFAFTQDMMKAAQAMVHGKYKMTMLKATNPLFKMQSGITFGNPMGLRGLSNGVRLLWIASNQDLGSIWQGNAYARKPYWNLAANMAFYATSKRSLSKRFPDLRVPPPGVPGAGTPVHLALLKYKGNWNPEPGSWPRMVKIAASRYHTTLTTTTESATGLNAAGTPIAHMTGTAAFTLSATERAALKRYLKSGGTLFADAAGGNAKFGDSFTKLARQLYPHKPLRRLPRSAPIYAGHLPGSTRIKRVHFRRYFTRKRGLQSRPRLLGVKVKGRYVIIFSPQDICTAFLGTHTWGILGYNKKTADPLAENILLYGSEKKH